MPTPHIRAVFDALAAGRAPTDIESLNASTEAIGIVVGMAADLTRIADALEALGPVEITGEIEINPGQ